MERFATYLNRNLQEGPERLLPVIKDFVLGEAQPFLSVTHKPYGEMTPEEQKKERGLMWLAAKEYAKTAPVEGFKATLGAPLVGMGLLEPMALTTHGSLGVGSKPATPEHPEVFVPSMWHKMVVQPVAKAAGQETVTIPATGQKVDVPKDWGHVARDAAEGAVEAAEAGFAIAALPGAGGLAVAAPLWQRAARTAAASPVVQRTIGSILKQVGNGLANRWTVPWIAQGALNTVAPARPADRDRQIVRDFEERTGKPETWQELLPNFSKELQNRAVAAVFRKQALNNPGATVPFDEWDPSMLPGAEEEPMAASLPY